MSVSRDFADFIYERLEPLGDIVMRRMFGSIGIYCDSYFFAIISVNVLYFKIDETNLTEYERCGMEPFKPYGPDGEAMSYYEVPADVLESDDQLGLWAGRAIDVARRAVTKRKQIRKKPK